MRVFYRKNIGSTNLMVLFLSVSNILSNILNLVAGFIVAKWLLPEELGQYNSFTIFTGYIILVQSGVPSGLGRELPLYLGSGDKERGYRYAATAQFWQVSISFIILTLGVLIGLCYYLNGDAETSAGLLVIAITSWQGLYVTKYLKVLFRTNKDFNKLSWIKIALSFVSFGSIALVYLYGFYGLCIRAIIIAFFDFVFTYTWRPIKVKPRFVRLVFKDLMKVGLPMYAVASIYSLWPTVQRTLILALGGSTALGLFAIATMVQGGMKALSSGLSSVMYPTMVGLWGAGNSVKYIILRVMKPFLIVVVLLLVFVPIAWVLLPILVQKVLPNYNEGIDTAQWMLVVGFLSAFLVFSNFYNMIKNQRDRLIMYLSGIAGWGASVYLLFRTQGYALSIFPRAMIVAHLIMIGLTFYHIRQSLHLKISKS